MFEFGFMTVDVFTHTIPLDPHLVEKLGQVKWLSLPRQGVRRRSGAGTVTEAQVLVLPLPQDQ